MSDNYAFYSNFFNNATPSQVAELERAIQERNSRKVVSKKVVPTVADVIAQLDNAPGEAEQWLEYYKTYLAPQSYSTLNNTKQSRLSDPVLRDLVQRTADTKERFDSYIENGLEFVVEVPLRVKVSFNNDFEDLLENHVYRGDLGNVTDWLNVDDVEVVGDLELVDDSNLHGIVEVIGNTIQDAVDTGILDVNDVHVVLPPHVQEDLNDLYQDFKSIAIDFDKQTDIEVGELVDLTQELSVS